MHLNKLFRQLFRWLDNTYIETQISQQQSPHEIDWLRVIAFILIHLTCVAVIWVGWSPVAVIFAVSLYGIRMFAITGFYHRYFSHKAFKTSRPMQFIFAVLGASAVQRGPLWWASHHRNHHAVSDQQLDAHSPVQHGFFWSHMGWFLSEAHFATLHERVKELTHFPELRFLDRYDILVPALLGISVFIIGECFALYLPEWNTNGWQLFVWGFAISTVALYHATFTVNSLAHTWGSRRYETKDQSRNNPLIALITLGEGWHNNHHHFPGAARQGFFWWEIDITYYGLAILSKLGLIWELRSVPPQIKTARKLTN